MHRERPPRARTLRKALLAGLGELFVVIGLTLVAYVVWALWWTSVSADRQAADLVSDFRQETSTPPNRTAAPAAPQEDPPEAAAVEHGQTIGVLIVPRWDGLTNNAMPILEGATADVLNLAAAGHYTDTQQVGAIGNFALAGHRRSYGDSFRYVNLLQPGDEIIIETAQTWYIYSVTSSQIVLPTQTDVIAPVPGDPDAQATRRLLTLTTCHSLTRGEFGNDHRWITHAELTGWMDRAEGTPQQILALQGGDA
ncbi:class E sortase [Cellulosimicrobium composti]|uniref:class E sortase n=1 Tax=Cellulosimicrobium composti TaxID=2672572 RepID=UPI0037A5E385